MADITRTPILSAVRAMHEADDRAARERGFDPYDTIRTRRLPTAAEREAEGILACFETQLRVQP